jgi:hypothetical protein
LVRLNSSLHSLQRIGGAQRLPLRKRESGTGEEFAAGFLEASKKLPIGSIVRVTNVANGRLETCASTTVVHMSAGAASNLSSRAAQKIGITRRGVAQVKVTKVKTSADRRRSLEQR